MRKYIIVLTAFVLSCGIFTGCKKAEVKEDVEAQNEPVVVEDIEPPEEEIEVSREEDGLKLSSLSMEEYYLLDMETFKEALENEIPDFRSILGVEDDREFTDDEWVMVKDLIFYTIYGKTMSAFLRESGLNAGEATIVEVDEYDDMSDEYYGFKVRGFTKEYLDELSAKDFYHWFCAWDASMSNGEWSYVSNYRDIEFPYNMRAYDLWDYFTPEDKAKMELGADGRNEIMDMLEEEQAYEIFSYQYFTPEDEESYWEGQNE